MTMRLADKLLTLLQVRHDLNEVFQLDPRTELKDIDIATLMESFDQDLEQARSQLIEQLVMGKDADWYLIRETLMNPCFDLGGIDADLLDVARRITLAPRVSPR